MTGTNLSSASSATTPHVGGVARNADAAEIDLPAVDRAMRRRRLHQPHAASAPVSPTALTPAVVSAATNRVLIVPASTLTTTSSVASSVIRSPSTWRFSMPATFSAASISLPPPCTIDQRRRRAARCARPPRRRSRAAPDLRAARRRTSGPARRSQQPGRLRLADHHVHVLHRLARRALQQVVDHRDENRAARRIDAPADVAEVRVRDVLDFRQRRADQPHERCRRDTPPRSTSPSASSVVPGGTRT